ncbi:MAG: AgmX/PglI C-terminal domain-containing protein [Deltaproteobacteria bacterium]|nr:AgmX/PglI C-terminal domain-containing protein [Deltaproteobacteria bacterium]
MTEASRPKILRIGVIQGGKIIEEKLVRKRGSVTVGSGVRNTIVLPAADVPKTFSLFEMRGTDYHLAFTDKMSGRVSVADQAADLQSLKAQNLVRKSGDTYHLKLNEGSRGRVSMGECIILFQFVSPPPEPVKPQLPAEVKGYWSRNIDWPYTSVFSFVSIAMLVMIIWAKQIPIVEREVSLEDIPDRFAKMIMPDKEKSEDEDGDGAGEAEKAPEPKKNKKEEVEDTGDDGGDEGDSAAVAKARTVAMEKKVTGRGLLKLLGAKGDSGMAMGGAVADVFAEGTVGGDGAGAFDGIGGGLDVATAAGQKGSRGVDGAASAANIKDLGTKGVVGGAGRGGPKKAEARIVAKVSSAALEEFDSDSRSQSDIKKVIRRRLGGIKHCYEKRLKRNPELKGKVVIRFVIHPGGKIIEVEIVENTTGDPELASCIKARVRAIRFPPADGGETAVVYPFILAPGG